MARRTLIRLVDDLDGTRAGQTVRFSLDHDSYEIDLNATNAQRLRAALAPFTARARPLGSPAAASGTGAVERPGARAGRKAPVDPEQLRAIRRWAAARGFQVPARGRIPNDVLTAYNQTPASH